MDGPTLLAFSAGGGCPWQQVTANGQILGALPDSHHEPEAGCYGMGRLFDRTVWIATEHHFWTERHGVGLPVEMIAGSSGRHLYRIVHGPKLTLPRPQIDFVPVLEEIDPTTWTVTRACVLPGGYRQFGKGHLAVDPSESVAYYTHEGTSGVVHRHDLQVDAPLPDLVARPVGSGGLLVLPNGSTVVGYIDGAQLFAPDGTHLMTYPVGALQGQGLLAHGADDSSFWVHGVEDGSPYSTLFDVGLDGMLRHQWNTPDIGIRWDAPFVDDQRWHY